MRRGLLLLWATVSCTVGAASPPEEVTCDRPSGDACLGIGPATSEREPVQGDRSVTGTPLAICSTDPMTGFFRDGQCRTGPQDRGVHVVCAEVDADFLKYTAGRGNDLSTPLPHVGFVGLQPGDRWCLCAARWEEARRAGVAPPVVLDATHPAALRHTTRGQLETHATSRTP